MKAHSGRKRTQPRAASNKPSPQQSGRSLSMRRTLPPHIRNGVAFTIIGLSVVGAFLLTPPPVAIAMALLAAVRLGIWRREVKREQAALASETTGALQP